MPASETARHFALKRLALAWAQGRGFRAAAAEVCLPQMRARIDVAACRIETRARAAPITAAAVFECKQARADFFRDSRSRARTLDRLAALAARKLRHEATLRPFYPSLLHGESLFPELDGCDFVRTGDECYLRLIAEIRVLSTRLRGQTKFENLVRWRAANLYYLVAEGGIFRAHELPAGWGLLVRKGDELELAAKPLWHETTDAQRLIMLQRIALAATRAVHRAHGVPPAAGGSEPAAKRFAKRLSQPGSAGA